jgi:hypothetical protein
VIVFADDFLFTNAGLLPADNALFLTELLRQGGMHVELAGELTGLVSPSPVSAVARGRLAPALAQMALLAVLFFLFKGSRFGRPMDPAAERRRDFVEHARAVGLHYARARAGRLCLELYGAYALERLRERLNLRGARNLSAIAEAVAARTGRPLGRVMRVLVEAQGAPAQASDTLAKQVPTAASDAEDLATLAELATLLEQTGGAGERSRVQGTV